VTGARNPPEDKDYYDEKDKDEDKKMTKMRTIPINTYSRS
jgi:hypothetical protein